MTLDKALYPTKVHSTGGWKNIVTRLALIGFALAVVTGAFAYFGGWFSTDELTPGRFADRFEEVNGLHPGFRRNHAKGLGVSGSFESNGSGVRLSKAAVFEPGRVPVIGRFSLDGGQPYQPDRPDTRRGLGLQFSTRNGELWRTAMINFPLFPVRTPEIFFERLLAFKPADAAPRDKNYLFDELITQIHQQALRWRLIVIVGEPGDPTNDPSIGWPAEREQVDVGMLTLDRVEAEEFSPATDINFDPLTLPAGMAPSDDPVLSARSAVYARSFARRAGETKQPSAITPADVKKEE